MKVLGLAADSGGCGFYRLRAPAEELRLLGVDIEVAEGIDADAVKYPDGMVQVNEVHTDADLIVVQRPLDNSLTAVIEQAKKQGIATVVEIDDDFGSVHRKNIAYEAMQDKPNIGNNWVVKACAAADHVTVSTQALAKYARHNRYSVLRNNVPVSIFDVEMPKSEIGWPRIGWTGSVQTHPEDLQVTRGAVGQLLKENGLPFNVIGDGAHVANNLNLDPETNLYATGWVDISVYYQNLYAFLDIGIVPLEMSPFNQAKSALKGLEYAALGIPFVASPTREYERLELYGVGKTAKSPSEWKKHLQRMIDRPSETERIAKENRDRIEAEHTYRVNAPQWIEAWEKAIDYRKKHHVH
ncbi:glycosyltransferase [Arthrobacter phage Atuin]|nr:glycosyltransferase [Arthrobacter phage Atuin]